MKWLPRPGTFAEGQRALMVWMLFGAGVATTLVAIGAALIVWLGEWPDDMAGKRLDILGWALLGGLMGMGSVIVSLAIGGPVGRFQAEILGGKLDVAGRQRAADHVADAAVDAAEDVK